MSKPKPTPLPAPEATPDQVVLRWLGGSEPQHVLRGIPARDLTRWDVERIAYVRRQNRSLPQGDVAADLVRSGLYERADVPRGNPAPAPDPTPADPAKED